MNATSASSFSLSFTESPLFISPVRSDDSAKSDQSGNADGVALVPAPLSLGPYTLPSGLLRGGFRYLTIVSNDDNSLTFGNVKLNITFMPHWKDDLSAYSGYFSAQDTSGFHDVDFLTKLWYAGAYTVQTNTIDANQARQNAGPLPGKRAQLSNKSNYFVKHIIGWANNASGGPVTGPILVDGAKRDRCAVFLHI